MLIVEGGNLQPPALRDNLECKSHGTTWYPSTVITPPTTQSADDQIPLWWSTSNRQKMFPLKIQYYTLESLCASWKSALPITFSCSVAPCETTSNAVIFERKELFSSCNSIRRDRSVAWIVCLEKTCNHSRPTDYRCIIFILFFYVFLWRKRALTVWNIQSLFRVPLHVAFYFY